MTNDEKKKILMSYLDAEEEVIDSSNQNKNFRGINELIQQNKKTIWN